jgi:uncharacterized DUF497 family protein
MPLAFEWDTRKAKANLRKHGVSFDEACTVFDDLGAKIFPDEVHSNGEEREIIVGYSILDRVLLVSFTERFTDRVRIISARKATRREQKDYEENIGS